ncbi:MAG: hypothetical protein C5B55_13710 [Blastocatellia bacterium]|nr:MAG: hypothetical protein C5B55_13710 [Blastocatellia bacterium]
MMFNNLIESSSHRKEFKRRGSFLLFTTATYALLFVITGVASIYAYDANLGEQSYEINWLPPVNLEATATVSHDPAPRPHQADNNRSNVPERVVAMLSVNHPEVVPTGVSVTPNKNLPLPPGGARIGPRDWDPAVGSGGPGPATGSARIIPPSGPLVIEAGDPPPQPPKPPVKILKVSRVLNSQAISLPKPVYPTLARTAGVQGTVNVQVLIDESGKVISAKAVSGHPLLLLEAQRAAMQARFSPTIVGDQPMKVSGVITYNFVIR